MTPPSPPLSCLCLALWLVPYGGFLVAFRAGVEGEDSEEGYPEFFLRGSGACGVCHRFRRVFSTLCSRVRVYDFRYNFSGALILLGVFVRLVVFLVRPVLVGSFWRWCRLLRRLLIGLLCPVFLSVLLIGPWLLRFRLVARLPFRLGILALVWL